VTQSGFEPGYAPEIFVESCPVRIVCSVACSDGAGIVCLRAEAARGQAGDSGRSFRRKQDIRN
jgi:hypothetical protein